MMFAFLDRPCGGYDSGCLDSLTVPPFTTGE
jgi:hypothetical protein